MIKALELFLEYSTEHHREAFKIELLNWLSSLLKLMNKARHSEHSVYIDDKRLFKSLFNLADKKMSPVEDVQVMMEITAADHELVKSLRQTNETLEKKLLQCENALKLQQERFSDSNVKCQKTISDLHKKLDDYENQFINQSQSYMLLEKQISDLEANLERERMFYYYHLTNKQSPHSLRLEQMRQTIQRNASILGKYEHTNVTRQPRIEEPPNSPTPPPAEDRHSVAVQETLISETADNFLTQKNRELSKLLSQEREAHDQCRMRVNSIHQQLLKHNSEYDETLRKYKDQIYKLNSNKSSAPLALEQALPSKDLYIQMYHQKFRELNENIDLVRRYANSLKQKNVTETLEAQFMSLLQQEEFSPPPSSSVCSETLTYLNSVYQQNECLLQFRSDWEAIYSDLKDIFNIDDSKQLRQKVMALRWVFKSSQEFVGWLEFYKNYIIDWDYMVQLTDIMERVAQFTKARSVYGINESLQLVLDVLTRCGGMQFVYSLNRSPYLSSNSEVFFRHLQNISDLQLTLVETDPSVIIEFIREIYTVTDAAGKRMDKAAIVKRYLNHAINSLLAESGYDVEASWRDVVMGYLRFIKRLKS